MVFNNYIAKGSLKMRVMPLGLFALAAIMMLSMVGCSSNSNTQSDSGTTTASQAQEDAGAGSSKPQDAAAGDATNDGESYGSGGETAGQDGQSGTPADTGESQAEQDPAASQAQGEQNDGADAQKPADTQGSSEGQAPGDGEDLVIELSGVTETAGFYPVEVDGTQLEVIAVKAPDGTVRTAFNTCQVCYDSGRGYYKQQGDVLQCQNCGNRFPMSRVEVEAGGCNPWPIFAENKTVDDENITISYDFLKESKDIFANWKVEW